MCYNFIVPLHNIAESVAVRVSVQGLVQGVNFRWFTQRRASELQLRGFARNQSDGSVLVVAEGTREAVEQLLDTVRVGPSSAVVENVRVEWTTPTGEFDRFEVRS